MNALPDPTEDGAFEGAEADRGGWLVTFSDLVLQLFAFVIVAVVLGAGSVPVGGAPPAAAARAPEDPSPSPVADLQIGWPILSPAPAPREPAPEPVVRAVPEPCEARPVVVEPEPVKILPAVVPVPEARLVSLGRYFEQLVRARGIDDAAEVSVRDGEFVMSLGETVGFAPGSDVIPPSGRALLAEVRAVARSMTDLAIEVSGHTDDRPIHTGRFPSNLHLSLARAARVARQLGADDPELRERIFASGYGAERPLVANDGKTGRARNRRVEIRLVP